MRRNKFKLNEIEKKLASELKHIISIKVFCNTTSLADYIVRMIVKERTTITYNIIKIIVISFYEEKITCFCTS